ncbi:MAG: SET domain-containing protein-lysine N-methyltransferase [Chitinophagales bacterium]|nr:SET domain-containing protein-lysine N-methyltransferase [Chitinophagales bacterium]
MNATGMPVWRLVSQHDIAEIRQQIGNGQNAFFTLRDWQAGDVIADFSAGTISAEPTYLTVQVDEGKHITLTPEFLQYINHSCDPNVFFDTTLMQLVALKDIKAGTECCFFYPSSEWSMTQSFHCYCGSPACLGEIKGAASLTNEQVSQYRFTDFIQSCLAKKAAKKVA